MRTAIRSVFTSLTQSEIRTCLSREFSMTAPNTPHVYSAIAYDAATGIVTADGQQFALDVFLQREVDSGNAHNINEARVKMGLAQIPTLPASPDGAGNPTFTAGAVAPASGYTQTAGDTPSAEQSVAPVILPIPHASAPEAHHVSYWASFLAYFSHAAVVTGHSLTNPAVLAVAAQIVAIKSPAAGAILTEVAQAEQSAQTPVGAQP